MTTALAMAVKPLALLAVLGALAYVRWLVIRHMPDNKLKRLLLTDV